MSDVIKKISTSAVAKSKGVASKVFFQTLESAGYIQRNNDSWQLTELGTQQGGEQKISPKYGAYCLA